MSASGAQALLAEMRARPAVSLGLGVALLVFLAACIVFLPPAVDWSGVFRPAALTLLAGRSPFSVPGYFNAPWTLLALVPFALLPEPIGRALIALASLACFAFAGVKLGAKPWTLALFLTSPPVLHSLLNGNLDSLTLLGVVVPPQLGLVLLATKPQIGLAVIIFRLAESWREGGARRLVKDAWPLAALGLLSIALYGAWPLRSTQEIGLWWNASLWPASIPFGLAFLALGLSRRQLRPTLVASPLLSPYVLLHAWVGALAATLESFPVAAAAVAGTWILVAIRAMGG